MARNISFLHYLRAHGNTPVPTQRPLLTGAVSGAIAAVPFVLLLYVSGAIASAARAFGINIAVGLAASVLLSIIGGLLYAIVFQRAANDRRGGWMFGMCFGFLLWTIGPVTLWQTITGRPIATGTAAMGIFGAQVFSGLVLGLVFPWVHRLFQGRLDGESGA